MSHVQEVFEWSVEAVERHPVKDYLNKHRQFEIAMDLTRLVIELEAIDPEDTE